MIEFDVLPERPRRRRRLMLAHDYEHADARDALDARRRASTTSPSDAFADVELDVDLKLPGYEERVVDGAARARAGRARARLHAVHAQPA